MIPPAIGGGFVGEFSDKGPLTALIWLTGVVFCQIFLTPMAAFSITYLVEFSFGSENFTMSFQTQMIPWIIAASLAYGMLALILALFSGGFTPIFVIERGGWRATLGLTRVKRDAASLRQVRKNHSRSPHAKMTVMVSVAPLALIIFIPETWIREQRRLEVALACYMVVLILVMRYFPGFARKHITIAAFTRRWLVSMTRLSWLAPVLVLWLMGRLASAIVLSWLGADLGQNIHLEQSFMEDLLNIGSVPDTSFLDLLTALAVMPLAAFTTLAVLGGGSGKPPDWMRTGNEKPIKTSEEEGDGGMLVKSGRVVGAVAGTAIGVGIGLAAAGVTGLGQKTNLAVATATGAAQAAPSAIEGTMNTAEASGEAFSFIDDTTPVSTDVSDLDLD